jgi:excisionase family DNA binding protein
MNEKPVLIDEESGEVDLSKPDPNAMTVGELASLLGVGTRKARKLAQRRRWIYGLETSTAGARYLVSRSAVSRHLAEENPGRATA